MTQETTVRDSNWFWSLLFLLFLTLKLTHVIGWSWWLVCAPLYGPLLFVLIIVAVMGIGNLLFGY